MNFVQMEAINGGQTVGAAADFDTDVDGVKNKASCAYGLATAMVFGVGGLIATAGSGGLAIGFAIAGMYASFIGAGISCR